MNPNILQISIYPVKNELEGLIPLDSNYE